MGGATGGEVPMAGAVDEAVAEMAARVRVGWSMRIQALLWS